MLQFCQKEFRGKSFWREIKEFVVTQDTILQSCHYFLSLHARIDSSGLYAQQAQTSHLVLHQGNERCNHYARSIHSKSWYLKGNALTTTSGHKSQSVLTSIDTINNLTLDATKARISPIFMKQPLCPVLGGRAGCV